MHDTYADKGLNLIAIYGIADEEIDTQSGTREFAKDQGFSFPVFFDDGNQLVKNYGVEGFPSAFLVDHEQQVVWKGDIRRKSIDEALRKHLSLPTPLADPPTQNDPDMSAEQRLAYAGRGEKLRARL